MGRIDVLGMIEKLREEILSAYPESKKFGKLAIIQVGDNPASELYIKSKKAELVKWGIEPVVIKFESDGDISKLALMIAYKIKDLNKDESVTGIILQLPLPNRIKSYENSFISLIHPNKNVDGFEQGRGIPSTFEPCTPKGIMYILKTWMRRDIKGKTVCLIGRGKTVGKPLIKMLSKEPCTLICCNSNTSKDQLETILGMSDIVISAVGKPGLIKTGYLKDGAFVIDAGISYVDGRQTGDYAHDNAYDDLLNVDYTPHLGGVGKMTVSMLALNTIEAYYIQNELE